VRPSQTHPSARRGGIVLVGLQRPRSRVQQGVVGCGQRGRAPPRRANRWALPVFAGIDGRSCGINANTPARSDHQRADPTSQYTPCRHPRRIGTHAIVVCEGRSQRGSGSKKPHLCLDAMPRKAGELRPNECHLRQTNASPEDGAAAILEDTPCLALSDAGRSGPRSQQGVSCLKQTAQCPSRPAKTVKSSSVVYFPRVLQEGAASTTRSLFHQEQSLGGLDGLP